MFHRPVTFLGQSWVTGFHEAFMTSAQGGDTKGCIESEGDDTRL